MPFAKRELPLWVIHAASAVALGLLLGFLGPYRTGTALEPAQRYGFWLGLTVFGYACVIGAAAALRSSGWLAERRSALIVPASALVSAVPQTPAVAWTLSSVQPGRTFSPYQLLILFGAVAVVQLAVALVAFAVESSLRSTRASAAAPAPEPQFLQRLPARLGRDLVALEAEDHYLRVHTSAGSELILGRLADAVSQLTGHDGLQVHRGWWVAANAVSGVEAKDGRTVLHLSNGIVAPVSRTYLQQVRARGWPPA